MPFGLHNAPATWQRLIDSVLGHDLEPHVFVYLDDVVVCTQTFEDHLRVLDEVFHRLREANITVSVEECQFCKPEMRYLGYVVDRNGLHVDPDKVKAMLELPRPTNISEVRRVVGTFSWYRRFIQDFSSVIAPITGLLRKGSRFEWSRDCAVSFQQIKECLVAAPILSCPDYSMPFVVQTDASGFGIGAVLTQPRPEGDKVISYLSRSLSRQERNFTTTERECLAVLWAVEKLRPYLEGVPFSVITDHYSLLWLHNLKDLTGRLARWSVRLQQYDLKFYIGKARSMWSPTRYPALFLWLIRWRLFKHVAQEFSVLSPPAESWKRVVPKADRPSVIAAAHDPPISGHGGVYKTFAKVAVRYYWPKMRQDIANFVKKCNVCTTHKVSQEGPVDKMVSHPKVERPWEMVSTDLMGPLPRSKHGNTFILVVTDYLSKFSLLFPLKRATSETVIRKLEDEVFLLFGVPRLLLCDNGPQYRSKQFLQFAERYQCRIKFSANYHPRANPTERVNRVIKTMLSMYVSENHRIWDEHIHEIACAIRTSRHETTKLTPYFVNFGRNMALSGDDYAESKLCECEEETQGVESSRNEKFRHMFLDVRKRLERAGEKSCERYNLRRRHVEYLPNQLVWKKNYVLSNASKYFSQKLAPRYVGPFLIYKKISPWMYELRDQAGNPKGVWTPRT
ncbi:hypothetical protein JTB14_020918 [Gonioctena quinquepunctata]|nr:hypothetical protein JTB14_020918 [Gonioctena quinquepunctata]